MKRHLLAAAAILLLSPTFASAKVIAVPEDAPVASADVPDDWKPVETDTGLQANSPDEAVYVYVDVATDTNIKDVAGAAVKFLTDNDVKLDVATEKTVDSQMNGFDAQTISYKGTDSRGPIDIAINISAVAPTKMLVTTSWGLTGENEKHQKTLDGIVRSLKPAK